MFYSGETPPRLRSNQSISRCINVVSMLNYKLQWASILETLPPTPPPPPLLPPNNVLFLRQHRPQHLHNIELGGPGVSEN